MEEFIGGMITLFCESINKLEKFIFNFYDFDRDCFITKEDVSLVFSYIPLNIKNKGNGINRLKFEMYFYLYIVMIIMIELSLKMKYID